MIYTGDYNGLLALLQSASPPKETTYLSGFTLDGTQQDAITALGWDVASTFSTQYQSIPGGGMAGFRVEAQQLNPGQVTATPSNTVNGQPVPAAISMRQARLALLQAGYLDTVTTAVNAAGQAAQITWEYASAIERHDPLLLSLMQVCGFTSQQMDQLFITASTL